VIFTLRFKTPTARTPKLSVPEIPVGPKWCEIRQIVFGWTAQKCPFTVKSVHASKTIRYFGQTLSYFSKSVRYEKQNDYANPAIE
jgi:hypothetical protein